MFYHLLKYVILIFFIHFRGSGKKFKAFVQRTAFMKIPVKYINPSKLNARVK